MRGDRVFDADGRDGFVVSSHDCTQAYVSRLFSIGDFGMTADCREYCFLLLQHVIRSRSNSYPHGEPRNRRDRTVLDPTS